MKILGLLQNQWVHDPARVEAMIARDPTKRRRILAMLLFAGCGLTGKRLRWALGDWCERIEWENADPEITDRPDVHVSGDLAHLVKALDEVKPSIVITFGSIACKTLAQTDWTGPVLRAPHPAARGPGVLKDLRGVRRQLDELASEEARG
jgi:hypothetical protein